MAREHATESEQEYTDKLKRIQTIIIDISTAISRSGDKTKKPIPDVYTKELEDWIREYSKQLPPPEQYIIPVCINNSVNYYIVKFLVCRVEVWQVHHYILQELFAEKPNAQYGHLYREELWIKRHRSI